MNFPALLSIVLGVILLLSRAPFIFAPQRTRDFYLRLLASNFRVRIVGLGLSLFAVFMIGSAQSSDSLLDVLVLCLGWALFLLGFFGLFLFAFIFKIIFESVLTSADNLILRGIGFLSAAAGAGLLYVGLAFW